MRIEINPLKPYHKVILRIKKYHPQSEEKKKTKLFLKLTVYHILYSRQDLSKSLQSC